MLVLRRASGQNIVIAGGIRVRILQVQGDQVKLGIEAPSDITILREELVRLEERQPISSASSVPLNSGRQQ